MENFEGSTPENPINNLKQTSNNPLGLLIGMGLGFLFFIIILVVLNYFTILELNKILPFLFSWLPTQSAPTVQNLAAVKSDLNQEEKAIYGFSLSDLPKIDGIRSNISAISINYTYVTSIKEIANVDKSTKKISTIAGIEGIPNQMLAYNIYTSFYFASPSGELNRTTIESLKKGQLIKVTRAYRLNKKLTNKAEYNWVTEKVIILPSQAKTPTPTQTAQ